MIGASRAAATPCSRGDSPTDAHDRYTSRRRTPEIHPRTEFGAIPIGSGASDPCDERPTIQECSAARRIQEVPRKRIRWMRGAATAFRTISSRMTRSTPIPLIGGLLEPLPPDLRREVRPWAIRETVRHRLQVPNLKDKGGFDGSGVASPLSTAASLFRASSRLLRRGAETQKDINLDRPVRGSPGFGDTAGQTSCRPRHDVRL